MLGHYEAASGEDRKNDSRTSDRSQLLLQLKNIAESASDLVPSDEHGYIGLGNRGNSCYMSSVMQIIFSISETSAPDKDKGNTLSQSLPLYPSRYLLPMITKLGVQFFSCRYMKLLPLREKDAMNETNLVLSKKNDCVEYGSVSPSMFYNVIENGHTESSDGCDKMPVSLFNTFQKV